MRRLSYEERQARDCTLSRYQGAERTCNWCGEPLKTTRQQRWCQQSCVDAWSANHWAGYSRDAAILRDGHRCLRCGRGPGDLKLLELLTGKFGRLLPPIGVDAFGITARGLDDPEDWERAIAWRRALTPPKLEVNHVIPVRGQRARHGSCLNHLDNLETLCHDCHVPETRLQIVSSRSVAPGTATIACWEGLHDRCWSKAPPGTLLTPHGPVASCACSCHELAEQLVG